MATKDDKKRKFIALLHELFQLNQPELDFGIYRIMHARKDDINRFIESDLPKIIGDAFEGFQSQDKQALQDELDKAISAAKAMDMDPDAVPKVQAIKEQLSQSLDLGREEGEVYDALITFFSRYYDEGDFVSRRVYKDGTYAIPYNGEEVVLHWANKDQYYIKSSETLRDYSFRLDPNNEENPMRVHFKLVDADPGAQNNVKETEATKRIFILDGERPWEEVDGDQGKELQLRFHYRATSTSDWSASAKASATAAAAKKPPTQDHCRQMTVEALLGANSDLPGVWKDALGRPYTKADGESADYSMLQGQLNNYTKRNTFDYFIHKDLGGFLTRELDFYVKNELLRWEDIAALKNQPARLAPLLSKAEVIRGIGEKIVAFLAQLEEFQKKLWLKKKFVTEANYCFTLDVLQGNSVVLEKVFLNEAQRNNWAAQFSIDIRKLDRDKKKLTWPEFISLPEYGRLVVDTAFFAEGDKAQLVAQHDEIDGSFGGQLFFSENLNAMLSILDKHIGQVKCIYIDPPYNTKNDDFLYKDNYRRSSWLALIRDRLIIAQRLLSDDGVIYISIDDKEYERLKELCCAVFGRENILNTFSVKTSDPSGHKTVNPSPYSCIEYVIMVTKDRAQYKYETYYTPSDYDPGYNQYIENIDDDYDAWRIRPLREVVSESLGFMTSREASKKLSKEGLDAAVSEFANNHCHQVFQATAISKDAGKDLVSLAKTSKKQRGEIFSYTRDKDVVYIRNGRQIYFYSNKIKKTLESDDFGPVKPLTNLWADIPWNGISKEGGVSLKNGKKPEKLLFRLISLLRLKPGDLVLDFFAGSGTTAAVSAKLGLKWIAIESNPTIAKLALDRLKRVAYGDTSGISKLATQRHSTFQYFMSESYEDCLANLNLNRAKAQQDLLDSQSPEDQAARESYLLNYMLDVETRGSDSLLNVSKFVDPTQYQLMVRNPTGDETKMVNVDLLETFNWLIGLTVEYIAAPIHFDAELSQGEHGRWQAKVKRAEDGRWWFRTVVGETRKGQKVLIVWRNLPSEIDKEDNGLVKDNAVLDAVLIDKLKIRMTESPDDEFDILYVNGDHNISIPKKRNGELLEARVKLIEEDFHRLMFSTETH